MPASAPPLRPLRLLLAAGMLLAGVPGIHGAASGESGGLGVEDVVEPLESKRADANFQWSFPPFDLQSTWIRHQAWVLAAGVDTVTTTERRAAAAALLDTNDKASLAALIGAIESGSAEQLEAISLALIERDAAPPAQLLDPLLNRLPLITSRTSPALAMALARSGEAAEQRLHALSADSTRDVSARLRAIEALAYFRNRSTAATLVELLNLGRSEPQLIIGAIDQSLASITGRAHGQSADEWRSWWETVHVEPREDWLASIADGLNAQLLALHAALAQERQRNVMIEQRLVDAYMELLRSMPIEKQLERLPTLLTDDLAPVRRYALTRIERLLRDQNLPPELQAHVVARLDDREPDVRANAARVLDLMGHLTISNAIAERLPTEQTPEVVQSYLTVLAHRPCTCATNGLAARLSQPEHRELAAEALWTVIQSAPLDRPPPLSKAVLEQISLAAKEQSSPALQRLCAAVGSERAVAELEAMLDGSDGPMRQAVAEGFVSRGLRAPLVDRAARHELYPFALQVMLRTCADMDDLRRIVRLEPPTPELVSRWAETIERAAERRPLAEVLLVDDLLAATPAAPVELRVRVMQRLSTASQDAAPTELRMGCIARHAKLLLQLHRPQEAYERIAPLNGIPLTPELSEIMFEACLLTAHFDRAAREQNDPTRWVSVLARIAPAQPEVAAKLHEEIRNRFAGKLTETVRQELSRIGASLEMQVTDDLALPAPSRAANAEPAREALER